MCSVKNYPLFLWYYIVVLFIEKGCLGGWRESPTGRICALSARGSESDPPNCHKTARLTMCVWNPRSEEIETGRLNRISKVQVPVIDPVPQTKVKHHLMLPSGLHIHVHTHKQEKNKTVVCILCPETTVYRNLLFMQEEVKPSCHYSTIMDLKIQ